MENLSVLKKYFLHIYFPISIHIHNEHSDIFFGLINYAYY